VNTPYLEPAGPRVALRPLRWADEAEFLAVTRASAGLHHPWMALPGTPEEFGEFMARFDKPAGNIGLVVCDRADDAIVGGININNIVHGRFQSADRPAAACTG
jgi:[ribosomal protein S5]-alanine N-acetyltransferase